MSYCVFYSRMGERLTETSVDDSVMVVSWGKRKFARRHGHCAFDEVTGPVVARMQTFVADGIARHVTVPIMWGSDE